MVWFSRAPSFLFVSTLAVHSPARTILETFKTCLWTSRDKDLLQRKIEIRIVSWLARKNVIQILVSQMHHLMTEIQDSCKGSLISLPEGTEKSIDFLQNLKWALRDQEYWIDTIFTCYFFMLLMFRSHNTDKSLCCSSWSKQVMLGTGIVAKLKYL